MLSFFVAAYYLGLGKRFDALSRTGVSFADVTASAPITLPSHASMMTGLAVPGHGVRNNGAYRLSQDHVTFAERLREAGYDTGSFVGSFVLDGRNGLDQGFVHYNHPPARCGMYCFIVYFSCASFGKENQNPLQRKRIASR